MSNQKTKSDAVKTTEKNTSTEEIQNQDNLLPIDIVAQFLQKTHKFELNKLSYEIEVTEIETGKKWDWDDINKARLKIKLMRQRFHGFKITDGLIDDVIYGILVRMYNPLTDFFSSLVWDKKDHIAALTNTITIEDKEIKKMFPTYLKKWLVAAYAQATNQGDNHTCLVLSGAQGRGKTKWLNNLCPQALKDMVFCGHIEPSVTNNNTANYLAEKLIVNIDDQLETMLAKDFNNIKSIITVPTVANRKAYFKLAPTRQRVCSFVASVNSASFLTDSSNRRYLVVPISDIADLEVIKKINMNQVWAQAKFLFESKFKYWFDKTDIKELDSLNESFRNASVEEEILGRYFYVPKESIERKFMLHCEILQFLQEKTDYKLNPSRLTHALQTLGFTKAKSTRINGKPLKPYVVGVSVITDTDELYRTEYNHFD